MHSRIVKSLVSILAFSTLAVQAQQTPNAFRGFRAEAVYDLQDIDQVSVYNGALGITIPLGLDYPVHGALSFQLVLRYNSTLFDAHRYSGPCTAPSECPVEMQPTHNDNAGLGWRVSLGRILAPGDFWNSTGAWVYVDPSGSEHVLYPTLHQSDPEDVGDDPAFPLTQKVLYSRDGSYIRAKRASGSSPVWTIEMPNGQIHTFQDVGTGDSNYRLTQIADPFGNTIAVSYSADDLTWTLTDDHRTYKILFADQGPGFPHQRRLVDTVQLPCFDCNSTTFAEVQFTYSTKTVTRPPGHTLDGPRASLSPEDDPRLSERLVGGEGERVSRVRPQGAEGGPSKDRSRDLSVRILDRIDLPEGLAYVFDGYNATGQITDLIVPTRGRIEWDWASVNFPAFRTQPSTQDESPDPYNFNYGVVERRHVLASGSVLGTWTYDRGFVDDPNPSVLPEVFTVTVTTPQKDQEKHYFSVFPALSTLFTPQHGTKLNEYGLPYTRSVPDPTEAGSGERFLSTVIYDCNEDTGGDCNTVRSVYVEYALDDAIDIFDINGTIFNKNRRLKSRLTLFDDDSSETEKLYRLEVFDDFDGLGHYRSRRVEGNFQSDAGRTTITDYNPTRGTYGVDFTMLSADDPWILGTYASVTTTEALQNARDPELDGDEHPGFDPTTRGVGVNSRMETTFDPDTGFLLCRRHLEIGTSRGTSDVLEVFVPDATGHVHFEKTYGGDAQTLPTAAGCGVGSLAPEFQRRHDYQYGTLAKTTVLDACDADYLTLFSNTIDQNTGLVVTSLDTTEQPTSLTYDKLGRITSTVPSGDARSEYTYVNANGTTAAAVTLRRRPTAGGLALTEERYLYDGFGRICKELVRMPVDWSRRDHTYHAQGWRKESGERSDSSGFGTECLQTVGDHLSPTKYRNYDPFGRVGKVLLPDDHLPDDHEVLYGYRGIRQMNRTVTVQTAAGNTAVKTQERYDPHGRLRKVSEDHDGAAVLTSYAYNVDGGLRQVAQGDQTRTFSTDRRGFLTQEIHPEVGSQGSQYTQHDSRGNILERTDGVHTLRYTYDAAERLVRVADDSGDLHKEFSYHRTNVAGERSLGKLYQAKRHNRDRARTDNLIVTETYRYGGLGGRVSERRTRLSDHGLAVGFTIGFEWDALGNLSRTAYPRCVHDCATDPARSVTNQYSDGLLTGVSGYANAITYHPNGLWNQIVHTNGVTDAQTNDPNDRPRPRNLTFSGPNVAWNLGDYTYDGAGNVTAIGADTFTYDAFHRLTHADLTSVGQSQNYTYDRFGNITRVTTNGSASTVGVSSATNRLAALGTLYDAAGNLTARGVGLDARQFAYDPFNMLRTLQDAGQHRDYIYTADDERLVEVDLTQDPPAETWSIRGLGGEVLRQYTRRDDGEGGDAWTWTKDYVHRSGQLLASVSPSGTEHVHLDHLGTTRLITNAAGAEVSRHTYFPFGEEVTAPGGEQMKFTGHERDANGPGTDDDLDYMHARYYSPGLCRFLSVDPVNGHPEDPQRWNLYAYVQNRPMVLVDPTGEDGSARISLDSDIQALQSGDIDVEEYVARIRARGSGALFAASLFTPGPEDLLLLQLAKAKPVAGFFSKVGGFFRKLLGKGAKSANATQLPDVTAAAERLGVDLRRIDIHNGVARAKVDFSESLGGSDIRLLLAHVRGRGAKALQIDSGLLGNERLLAFLERRAKDGRPFHGGIVRKSAQEDTDFIIHFGL